MKKNLGNSQLVLVRLDLLIKRVLEDTNDVTRSSSLALEFGSESENNVDFKQSVRRLFV